METVWPTYVWCGPSLFEWLSLACAWGLSLRSGWSGDQFYSRNPHLHLVQGTTDQLPSLSLLRVYSIRYWPSWWTPYSRFLCSRRGSRRGRREGCAANLHLFRALVKRANSKPSSLYVTRVDLKKVGHPSLLAAMRRWGLPSQFIEYILSAYAQAATVLGGERDPSKISREVVQGDPLSPFLFNICLNWALSAIPEEFGVEFGARRFFYLGFADDITLCVSFSVEFQASLDRLVEAGGTLGLKMGIHKCATLGVMILRKKED